MARLFKTKKSITAWLDKHNVEHYTLVPDPVYGYVVDLKYGLNLQQSGLRSIPVKFNVVKGDFDIYENKLTTLNFSPKEVEGFFDCSLNNIKSLKGCPRRIVGSFAFSQNPIKKIEDFPDIVGGRVYCLSNSKLGNLQFVGTSAPFLEAREAYGIEQEKSTLQRSIGPIKEGMPQALKYKL